MAAGPQSFSVTLNATATGLEIEFFGEDNPFTTTMRMTSFAQRLNMASKYIIESVISKHQAEHDKASHYVLKTQLMAQLSNDIQKHARKRLAKADGQIPHYRFFTNRTGTQPAGGLERTNYDRCKRQRIAYVQNESNAVRNTHIKEVNSLLQVIKENILPVSYDELREGQSDDEDELPAYAPVGSFRLDILGSRPSQHSTVDDRHKQMPPQHHPETFIHSVDTIKAEAQLTIQLAVAALLTPRAPAQRMETHYLHDTVHVWKSYPVASTTASFPLYFLCPLVQGNDFDRNDYVNSSIEHTTPIYLVTRKDAEVAPRDAVQDAAAVAANAVLTAVNNAVAAGPGPAQVAPAPGSPAERIVSAATLAAAPILAAPAAAVARPMAYYVRRYNNETEDNDVLLPNDGGESRPVHGLVLRHSFPPLPAGAAQQQAESRVSHYANLPAREIRSSELQGDIGSDAPFKAGFAELNALDGFNEHLTKSVDALSFYTLARCDTQQLNPLASKWPVLEFGTKPETWCNGQFATLTATAISLGYKMAKFYRAP